MPCPFGSSTPSSGTGALGGSQFQPTPPEHQCPPQVQDKGKPAWHLEDCTVGTSRASPHPVLALQARSSQPGPQLLTEHLND